jgi:aryl-alcohol dehydrogenase-like predicted oxidoreductase
VNGERRLSRRELLQGAFAAGAASLLGRSAPAAQAGPMMQRGIPSSGESVPAIGLGTWQTFDVGESIAERAPLREVLRLFLELGGRVIDSSPMYGRSEAVLGDLAAELGAGDRLFLATKVWTRGRADGIRQMETSMERLRTGTVDLMQVHNLLDADTHLDTLAGWKRDGRVRYIGVTHYTAGAHDDLERAIRAHTLDFIQVNLSVAERQAEERLLPFAADRGVAVIINRPFAEGALFRAVRERALPDWAADLDCTTWAQLFLKYILALPAVTVVIPATADPDHLEDNMRAGTGRLPDAAQRRRIVEAVTG